MSMPMLFLNRDGVRRTSYKPLQRIVAVLGVALLLACAPRDLRNTSTRDAAFTASVQRVALRALFLERERAASIVLFADPAAEGPVFALLGETHVPRATTPEPLQLYYITLAELETLFAENVDGWAAFFRRYPKTAGLVEVGPVRVQPDKQRASLTIARSCGEHCRMAWRVEVVWPGLSVEEVTSTELTVASITSFPAEAVGR